MVNSWLPLLSRAFDKLRSRLYTVGAECKVVSIMGQQINGAPSSSRVLVVEFARPHLTLASASFVVPTSEPELSLSAYRLEWIEEDHCYYAFLRPTSNATFPLHSVPYALNTTCKTHAIKSGVDFTDAFAPPKPRIHQNYTLGDKLDDILHLEAHSHPLTKAIHSNIDALDLSTSKGHKTTLAQYNSSDPIGAFPTYYKWHETKQKFQQLAYAGYDGLKYHPTSCFVKLFEATQRFNFFNERAGKRLERSKPPAGSLLYEHKVVSEDTAKITLKPAARIHHSNFNDLAIEVKSDTPAAVSLWATTSKGLGSCATKPYGDIRKKVLQGQAAKFIDPYVYDGPAEYLQYTGTKLREAVTGHVRRCYLPCGKWLDDHYAMDEERPEIARPDEWHWTNFENCPARKECAANGQTKHPYLPMPHSMGSVYNDLVLNEEERVQGPFLDRLQIAERGMLKLSPLRNSEIVDQDQVAMSTPVESHLSFPSPLESNTQQCNAILAQNTYYQSPTGEDWAELDEEEEEEEPETDTSVSSPSSSPDITFEPATSSETDASSTEDDADMQVTSDEEVLEDCVFP